MPGVAVRDLEQSCGELAATLGVLRVLMPAQDADGAGVGARPKPGSKPPWNVSVATVETTAHEGARRLEAALRLALTGRPGQRRGGSVVNTEQALRAIATLAFALGATAEDTARIIIDRWLTSARQLPAIDEAPVWRTLAPGPDGLPPRCPYCEAFQLRVAVRSRTVMCFSPACPGDREGKRPQATMELGAASGQPMLVWQDGSVQLPP